MGGKSKQKGSSFEREVCKTLSLWITGGKDKELFWRSAMSGGRATRASKKGLIHNVAGDICAVGAAGHALTDVFFVECKNYRDLSLENFFVKQSGILAEFWARCFEEAHKHRKIPMLIAKQNRTPTLVVLPPKYLKQEQVRIIVVPLLCEITTLEDMTSQPYSIPRARFM